MKDMLPIWTENLAIGAQHWVTGLLILVLLLILMYLLRNPMRYWWEGRRITRAVKRLGARVLRNVNLPDGMGGEIRIDFLMLSNDAILVIGVKRYDGMIFGGAQTDEWTQTINSRSYKFPNPDNYLLQQVSAIKSV
ncbi:MAG: nuclease-related domain-containing protein, partial [Pseudomonadota bacterium]